MNESGEMNSMEDRNVITQEEEDDFDRFSSLPNILIADILSLLPIKSAVATSALSRRWRHLWTQISHLVFSLGDYRVENSQTLLSDFVATVDNTIRHLTSPKIHSFKLNLGYLPDLDPQILPSFVASWIHLLCDGRNPENIELIISGHLLNKVLLPSCLFQCQTLVSLHLVGQYEYELRDDVIVSLPNLRNLVIEMLDSNLCLLPKLFNSSLVLEDLDLSTELVEDSPVVNISCRNLRSLCLRTRGRYKWSKFFIDAPNLESISICDFDGSFFRFVENPSELRRAYYFYNAFPYDREDVSELIKGISSTRFLILSGIFPNFRTCLSDDKMPIFLNLTKLELDDFCKWSDLLNYLRCFPYLEVLVLVMSECGDYFAKNDVNRVMAESPPVCLLTKLKLLEIRRFQGLHEDMIFMEYILRNANVLEKLVVTGHNFDYVKRRKELLLCGVIFGFPMSSVACEIKFYGQHFNVSSKDLEDR